MTTKALSLKVKDADKGLVTAVFSTFDVIDADGDVTRPGAFEEGAAVRISAYGHGSWSGELPVGRGTIRQTKTEAMLDGQFFLETVAGKETFAVVKAMGDLQDWSYGYEPKEYSFGEFEDRDVRFLSALEVYEVSPVLIGAGVNTRTLLAKSRGDMRFTEQAGLVVAALAELLDRADDVVASRREKGKHLGSESSALLSTIEGHIKRLDALLRAPDPNEELTREYLRAVARDLALTS